MENSAEPGGLGTEEVGTENVDSEAGGNMDADDPSIVNESESEDEEEEGRREGDPGIVS